MLRSRRAKAVVVGVGAEEGLGAALCRRFAAEGQHVLVVGRTRARIEHVARSINESGGSASPIHADASREEDVVRLFDLAMSDEEHAPADLVAFSAGSNLHHDFRTLPAAVFEDFWRNGCFSAFLVGREVARRFAPMRRGTMIFTGASGSLRGKPGFAQFASAKAGTRALAQAMARELGPQGVHVAHVVIDGAIDGDRVRALVPELVANRGEDGLLRLSAIADAYWALHRQDSSAWTHELDLRPFKEPF